MERLGGAAHLQVCCSRSAGAARSVSVSAPVHKGLGSVSEPGTTQMAGFWGLIPFECVVQCPLPERPAGVSSGWLWALSPAESLLRAGGWGGLVHVMRLCFGTCQRIAWLIQLLQKCGVVSVHSSWLPEPWVLLYNHL